MRIPLPNVRKEPNGKAHTFPVQIALQTQEFLQATIFHHAFMDIAAGQRVREPNGFAAVEKELLDGGLTLDTNNQAWALIQKYQDIFNRFVYQNVLILLRSHWNWYIDKIGAFTVHGRSELGGPSLSNAEQKELERVSFASIRKQIEILERSTGITFSFAADTLNNSEEMALVRNLGIHNRWEVNDFYKSKTKSTPQWTTGDIRVFTVPELETWHKSLINMTHETCFPIAKLYFAASDFPTLAHNNCVNRSGESGGI